ncbi:MAG: TrmB family transcriptional regulator [Halobacteriales archaeon]|nr:TrmB family transcriptional regulator [Halobacteriales archaeon]
MPIEVDEFEEAPDDALEIDRDTNKWEVVEFLLKNSKKAFTPKEIEENVDVPENSVGVILSRLEEKDIVRHKGKYWTLERDDRLAGVSAMLASTQALNDELGTEDLSEWAEHAEEDVEQGL